MIAKKRIDSLTAVESEIEIVEPMGAETVAWTELGAQTFTFRTDAEIDLQLGQKS